jgi:hypothetical protein
MMGNCVSNMFKQAFFAVKQKERDVVYSWSGRSAGQYNERACAKRVAEVKNIAQNI